MYALMANTGQPEGKPPLPPAMLPAEVAGGVWGKPLSGKTAGIYWKVPGPAGQGPCRRGREGEGQPWERRRGG